VRPSVILQSPSLRGQGVRAIFEWREDRYCHRIEWIERGQPHLAMNSLEGLHADHWPSSPPLQQLHVEDRGAGQQIVLLVGMSGREHWSASVEAAVDGKSLIFDIACRVGTPGVKLRSTYEIDGNCQSNWELAPLECDQRISQVVRDGRIIEIAPPHYSAPTIRWKYQISTATGLAPVV
jgi:hypothetical protein